MLERLIGYFYPVAGASEERRERAGLFIVGGVLGILISTLAGLTYTLVLRDPTQVFANILGVAFCVAMLSLLRRSRSIELVMNITAAVMTFAFGLSAILLRDVTQLIWLGLVPIAVLTIGQVRLAATWFVLTLGMGVGAAVWLNQRPDEVVTHSLGHLLLRGVIFLCTVFGLTLTFALGRARTQRSLVAARDEANRANALKSAFLANFSHEIRTPLNGVIGTADLLLASTLPLEVRDQVQVIQRCGTNLLRTINDVLELSRIEAGRLDLFPVPTDLPALLNEVVELFQARARAQGLLLTLELESGHPTLVQVDDLRLRQVVQNLVSNAIKFTPVGRVVVRLGPANPVGDLVQLRLSVSDTGPGISPESAARLFSAFTQARAETDRNEGSGLGLALCKQFVELMGGELLLQSAPGQGATFTVAMSVAPAMAHPSTPSPTPQPALQPLKVLVVDDNEINLRVAAAMVTKLGHQVGVARDGEQALAAIAKENPDVVLMDCHMPGIDGLEATRRLRAQGDGRPVVALTASVYAEDRARCQAAGMNFFLSKPMTLSSLQTALAEVAGALRRAPASPDVTQRVLVIDDDPHVRRMTVRLLRAEGFEVSDAGDVEEASLLYERTKPGYLVVDHVLGGAEDGMHFAERLCRDRPELQVVVTSGQPPTTEQLSSLHAVGGRFLPKPYNRRGLMELLRARRTG